MEIQMTGIRSKQQWVSLNKLRKQGIFCDIKFYTENESGNFEDSGMAAHSCVLAASSPVLYSRLLSYSSCTDQNGSLRMSISVPNVSPAVWELVLDYIYSKKASISNLLPDNTITSFVNILSELKLVSEIDFKSICQYCENELGIDDIGQNEESYFQLTIKSIVDSENELNSFQTNEDVSYDGAIQNISLDTSLDEDVNSSLLKTCENDDAAYIEGLAGYVSTPKLNGTAMEKETAESMENCLESDKADDDTVDYPVETSNWDVQDKIGKELSLDLTKAICQKVVYRPLKAQHKKNNNDIIPIIMDSGTAVGKNSDEVKKFNERQKNNARGKSWYECETCGKKFIIGASLSRHIQDGCNPSGKPSFPKFDRKIKVIKNSRSEGLKKSGKDIKLEPGSDENNESNSLTNNVLDIVTHVKEEPLSDGENHNEVLISKSSESQFVSSLFEDHDQSQTLNKSQSLNLSQLEAFELKTIPDIEDSSASDINNSDFEYVPGTSNNTAKKNKKKRTYRTKNDSEHVRTKYFDLTKKKKKKTDNTIAGMYMKPESDSEVIENLLDKGLDDSELASVMELVGTGKILNKRTKLSANDETSDNPDAAEPLVKKKRGRPFGSKNKAQVAKDTVQGNDSSETDKHEIDLSALGFDSDPSLGGESDGSVYEPAHAEIKMAVEEDQGDVSDQGDVKPIVTKKKKKKVKSSTPRKPAKVKEKKVKPQTEHRPVYKTLKNHNVCNLCGKVFTESSREKIMNHQKTECNVALDPNFKNRPKFMCPFCSKILSCNYKLTFHIKVTHLGERPYVCNMCQADFKDRNTHRDHMMQAHNEGVISCKYCGQQFFLLEDYKKHKWSSHFEESEKDGGKKYCYKSFMCEICSHCSPNEHKLKMHLLYHKDSSHWDFECELCKKRFVQRQDLMRHMMIHTGEKPFLCELCSYTTNRSSNLKLHMRKHIAELCEISGNGEANGYKCQDCEAIFKNKTELKDHLRVHDSRIMFTKKHFSRKASRQKGKSSESKPKLEVEDEPVANSEETNDEQLSNISSMNI